MNFLAHLHLATLAQSSLLGNLAADFVKGDPYQNYSTEVADGVMMHRRVDRLTDTLPAVKQARMLFSERHYRIAPITLDVVWDHFLAKYWPQYEQQFSLSEFNRCAEQQIAPHLNAMPEDFQHLSRYLWQDKWLENYADLSFIARVLKGMAARRPKLARLETSIDDVERHYVGLEHVFRQFYPEMQRQAKLKLL